MNDQTLMPFGRYEGAPMEDVPASYLLYLWEGGIWNEPGRDIHVYIKECFSALEKDCPDTIVKHRPR